MLEVRAQDGGFVLFDTDLSEAVMRFADCRSADQRVAELKVNELQAALERRAPKPSVGL